MNADQPAKHHYLPGLTVLLLVTVAVWFAAHYVPMFLHREHHRHMKSMESAADVIQKHYVRQVDEQQLVHGALTGMVDALGDPYSHALSAEEYRTTMDDVKGEFGGIGARIAWRDGVFEISEVLSETPAERAGLKQGDLIYRIDGELCADLGFVVALSRIRGKVGTDARLGIRRPTGDQLREFELNITRDTILMETVEPEDVDADGIAYVKLSAFDEHSAANLRHALEKIANDQSVKGLILDLRYNPGGSLDAATDIADAFLPKGNICSIIDRAGKTQSVNASTRATVFPQTIPIALLVNEGTASAAEVLAGALKDNRRAVLVGFQTYGKGTIVQPVRLPNGMGIIIATAHYKTPAGTLIERKGITPDIQSGDSELQWKRDDKHNSAHMLPPKIEDYVERRRKSDAKQRADAKAHLLSSHPPPGAAGAEKD